MYGKHDHGKTAHNRELAEILLSLSGCERKKKKREKRKKKKEKRKKKKKKKKEKEKKKGERKREKKPLINKEAVQLRPV